MAVGLRVTDPAPPAGRSSVAFLYRLYGFPVRSDIALPLRPASEEPGNDRGWTFRFARPGDVPRTSDAVTAALTWNGPVYAQLRRGPDGDWIWCRDAGTCHVGKDPRTVIVYPEDRDSRELQLMLIGLASVHVLRRLGYAILHASAIVTDGEAVGFLGDHGQGKSTIAASFIRRGATLLTDDALPLSFDDGAVVARPGVGWMKVFPDTAERTLERSDLPKLIPSHESFDKQLLLLDDRYRFAKATAPLRALYVLQRYDAERRGRTDVVTRPLAPREMLTSLLAQTSWKGLLEHREAGALMPLYATLARRVPIRVLTYPHGYEYQDDVRARVLADLEAS